MGQGKSREQEVAEISRGLKKMAKQHGCPVITASQLNEEGRTRESRAIVNDADVLLTIDPEDEKVVISKNREGERGVGLNLRMNGQYQRFEEYN
jgi:replicative DNA helicase